MELSGKKNIKGFSIYNIGSLSKISNFSYLIKNNKLKINGKLFLKEVLNLTGCEISLNSMNPGDSLPFIHKHRNNEEIFIVIKGEGQILLNGIISNISEGTIISIEPKTERAIRNNSTGVLIFIVIQARLNSFKGKETEDGFSINKIPKWN